MTWAFDKNFLEEEVKHLFDFARKYRGWKIGSPMVAFQNINGHPLFDISLLKETVFRYEEGQDSLTASQKVQGAVALLIWALKKDRPQGEKPESKYNLRWRHYLIPYYYYIDGWSEEQIKEEFNLEDAGSIRKTYRPNAIKRVTESLWIEIFTPREYKQRQQILIDYILNLYSQYQREIVRTWTLLDYSHYSVSQFVDASNELYNYFQSGYKAMSQSELHVEINSILNSRLFEFDPEANTVLLDNKVRDYFASLRFTRQVIPLAHFAASYVERRYPLTGARLYRLSRNYEKGAKLLIENRNKILQDGDLQTFYDSVNQFRDHELSSETKEQLILAAGQTAERVHNFELAAGYYEQLFQSKNKLIKGRAYYYAAYIGAQFENSGYILEGELTKTLEETTIRRAFFQIAIDTLKEGLEDINLVNDHNEYRNYLFQVHMTFGSFLVEKLKESQSGKNILRQGKEYIDPDKPMHQIRFRSLNAIIEKHEDEEAFLKEFLDDMARTYAEEKSTNEEDIRYLLHSIHNYAMSKAFQKEIESAYQIAETFLKSALSRNDKLMTARFNRILGAIAFFDDDFEKAQEYYCLAKSQFQEMRNWSDLGVVYHDLAENLVKLGRESDAIQAFARAWSIGIVLKDKGLQQFCKELKSSNAEEGLNSFENITLSDDASSILFDILRNQENDLVIQNRSGLISKRTKIPLGTVKYYLPKLMNDMYITDNGKESNAIRYQLSKFDC